MSTEALPREALEPQWLDDATPYINTPQNQYKVWIIIKYVITLIFDILLKLPYADFIIEDSLAGTTPVTT